VRMVVREIGAVVEPRAKWGVLTSKVLLGRVVSSGHPERRLPESKDLSRSSARKSTILGCSRDIEAAVQMLVKR